MTPNPLSLHRRTILVTGASSGIGRETAVLLSELGARLVLSGRNVDRLEHTRGRLAGEGHAVSPFDLADCGGIAEWVKRICAGTGPLDGVVHSAGVQQTAPLRVVSAAKSDELLHANVTSAIMLTKAFRQRGCNSGGSVVLVSSVIGLAGRAAASVYAASKAALAGFSRSAAMELAPEGIRVNCVAPGYVETEMLAGMRETLTAARLSAIGADHPLGLGTPRDVAHSIAFLLAETGRWITGTTLVVDGGYTCH